MKAAKHPQVTHLSRKEAPGEEYILTIDEGTSSVRAILWSSDEIIASSQRAFTQIYPKPGWVEHDPEEIWRAALTVSRDILRIMPERARISCIGVTNQRETTVIWDKMSGKPVYNAIVWQDRRTADMVEELRRTCYDFLKQKTGLIPDSYFSAVKVRWMLENIPGLRRRAERGEVLFGTIDSFLIWRLTSGRVHVTDPSNASRTMLFNIHRLEWDQEILEALDIPEGFLPEVKPSSHLYGYASRRVLGVEAPISGDLGDQQAALFGQTCFRRGEGKCTYGTGNFILVNVGRSPKQSESLLSTIAWQIGGETTYALEGSIFVTGAGIQWLIDGLELTSSPEEVGRLASSVKDTGGVYFVPALTGLGAPYWDQYARGLLVGITRGTSRSHVARAVLESIAFSTRDVLEASKAEGLSLRELKADGGASRNDFLMQLQADIAGIPVLRPKVLETTSLGAAFAAGLAVGFWRSLDELRRVWHLDRVFHPSMSPERRERLYSAWREAVKRASGWARFVE